MTKQERYQCDLTGEDNLTADEVRSFGITSDGDAVDVFHAVNELFPYIFKDTDRRPVFTRGVTVEEGRKQPTEEIIAYGYQRKDGIVADISDVITRYPIRGLDEDAREFVTLVEVMIEEDGL